jgi:hypothetical protein
MTKILRNLIVEDVNGEEYQFEGGGGSGSQPAPNSVGSSEIQDHSVQEEDLDPTIVEKLDMLEDENIVTEEELEDDWAEAMRNAGLDPGTIEQNGGDDDVTAEDLESDWNNAINEADQELNG